MLSWDPPIKPNGIIIRYDLNLFGPERNNSFSTTNNFIILEDLLPFTLYSIYAAARTIKGPGPSAVLQFYTDESGEQIKLSTTSKYQPCAATSILDLSIRAVDMQD